MGNLKVVMENDYDSYDSYGTIHGTRSVMSATKPTMGIFDTAHEIRMNLQNVYSSAIDAIDSFILSCINQEVEFNYNLFSVLCAVVLTPRAHLPNFVCAAFFVCFFTNANVEEDMLCLFRGTLCPDLLCVNCLVYGLVQIL